ncbi:MAG: DUF4815 domain-containing protein, partial [Betaproteobacteria bacterium]|nr:DUF4815 domain-containing protein [Betaproteobacteria bacterium]
MKLTCKVLVASLALSPLAISHALAQTFLPDTVITASRVLQRAQDALPDVSVLSIISITQGATTYHSPQDYFLNGDK